MGALSKVDAANPAKMTIREQYLSFMLNGEVFAIGILAIREIIEYGTLTELPGMPAAVRGVINLRGAAVPVIDLCARFGIRPSADGRRRCIVIIEAGGGQTGGDAPVVGVLVDAVNEVLDIAASQIEPAPSFGAAIRSDFIRGMGKVAGRFVIMLNVERLLSLEELGEIAAVGLPQ